TDIRERTVAVIAEKKAWSGIASYINIGPAVIVEVRSGRRHHVTAVGFRNARRFAYIDELTLAVVVVERSYSRPKTSRSAKNGNTLPVTERILAWRRDSIEVELEITCDKQVE